MYTVPSVEAGQGSKHTWWLRYRFNRELDRPHKYIMWITDDVYRELTADENVWKQYRAQLVALWRSENESE
jgi:hypothetical protein